MAAGERFAYLARASLRILILNSGLPSPMLVLRSTMPYTAEFGRRAPRDLLQPAQVVPLNLERDGARRKRQELGQRGLLPGDGIAHVGKAGQPPPEALERRLEVRGFGTSTKIRAELSETSALRLSMPLTIPVWENVTRTGLKVLRYCSSEATTSAVCSSE